jgi:hypothetical protein
VRTSGLRRLVAEEQVLLRQMGTSARGRLQGGLLLVLIVLVQLAWGATLVYLGVRFL